ncbi:hypothetical protein PP16_gp19 [Pectobacterium phage PP16]|uniref:Uncharacterized protein n=1 Tax=Pectobacterium phage PP16 TaxID=1873958 RepID=A0A1B1PEB6_9CAUD|nr:hypothetical protein PP16_gp19 [Pectobacterium phage PP16]ANT45318.1 hypothetical protein PP16_gp19 [Pectobacterium phage PP16]
MRELRVKAAVKRVDAFQPRGFGQPTYRLDVQLGGTDLAIQLHFPEHDPRFGYNMPKEQIVRELVRSLCHDLERTVLDELREESVRIQTRNVKPDFNVLF